MKPIIGITPSAQTDMLAHGTFRRYVLSSPYVRAVEAAGGIPLILPPQGGNVESLTQVIDGLLLSGGADINPVRYGESSIHPETYGIDDERDRFELDLFDAMLQREKPVFGICRGIQVINVALGGTLIQDIASQHPGMSSL
jgi:putative glutamine amidotransferase